MRVLRSLACASALTIVCMCATPDAASDLSETLQPGNVSQTLGLGKGSEALQLGNVSFEDDFIGFGLSPRFAVSTAGAATVGVSSKPSIGGWARLHAPASSQGVARMRLGEDPGTGVSDVMNFAAEKHIRAVSRVKLDAVDGVQATVGFVSINDPDNVGGALLYRPKDYLQKDCLALQSAAVCATQEYRGQWFLQACSETECSTVETGWKHTPGAAFDVAFDIRSYRVRAYINGELKAEIDQYVPPLRKVFEWQLWNVEEEDGNWSDRSMYVDAIKILQER